MLRSFLLLSFTLMFTALSAQTDHREHSVEIRKSHTMHPGKATPGFDARLRNIEAPTPSGSGYKSFLMRQKIKSRDLYPIQQAAPQKKSQRATAPEPLVGEGFNITYKFNFGVVVDYSGGIPNDNTLAISNGGMLLAAINGGVFGMDTNEDTLLFPQNHILGLGVFADSLASTHLYDPKLIYDEGADRFILVFLRDNVPASSAMIVAFSSSNNPGDPWHVYEIPGNPINNNRWTDFPAINITDDELFITGNLIIPNEPWQIGFDGSVIWQIDKNSGYSGASNLPNKLYSDIRFNGRYTRNLHPVTGIESTTTTQYFLSNRNFDISNDTIFVMQIDGTLDEPSTTLQIGMGKTSPNYGVPPNGRQEDTDLSDPTAGLQTNDARVLGAITNGDWIQFVGNTVNPATGFSAIYHGMISNPGLPNQEITGTILGDDTLDFGYPNIAYTGNEPCDIETMIGFNFTSPTDYPGVGAIYFGNDSTHSELVRIKNGENYVDKHQDSYERWGDYFGLQSKFDETGKVWLAGFYGLDNNGSGTWINKMGTPDTSIIMVQAGSSGNLTCCQGRVDLQPSGGFAPYTYYYNGGAATSKNFYEGICEGESLTYTVSDSRGCTYSDTITPQGDPMPALTTEAKLSGSTVYCEGRVEITASGGVPPYTYSFNNGNLHTENFHTGICDGDTIIYTVADSCGIAISDTLYAPLLVSSTENAVYPNPSSDHVVGQFRIEDDQQVAAYIFDMKGNIVTKVFDAVAKKGLNEFQFSVAPLRQGMYVLKVLGADETLLYEEKIIKHNP